MSQRPRHGPTESIDRTLERGWAAFDDGHVEDALALATTALRRTPGNPDATLLRAACRIELGEPAAALADLDPLGTEDVSAEVLFFRGLALYDLARVSEARTVLERAVAIEPEWCDAHYELARALDHLGDDDGARRHYRRAHALHADGHPLPLEIDDAEFDALVKGTLRALPAAVRKELGDVPVVVEPAPSAELLQASDPPLPPDLLGLFVGPSLLEQSHGDLPSLPPTIYIFRKNLLRACADRDELAEQVAITVQHEVGHMIGADEKTLEDWGLG